MTKALLIAAALPFIATAQARADFTGLTVEFVDPAEEGWDELGYPVCHLDTYRVYATFDDDQGLMLAVGDADGLFEVTSSDGAFWNSPHNTAGSSCAGLRPPIDEDIDDHPEVLWDTFVTIGEERAPVGWNYPHTQISLCSACGFEDDMAGSFTLDNCGWFVEGFPPVGDAVTGRVLVAQFTVNEGVQIAGTNWRCSGSHDEDTGSHFDILDSFVSPAPPAWDPVPWLDEHHGYVAIDQWMDCMGFQHGDAVSAPIGDSFEGRNLGVIRISPDPDAGRPALLLTGGVHANERLGSSIVMYLAHRLLTDDGSDPRISALLDVYDVHLVPLVNPDGYEYALTNDPQWIKSRGFNQGTACRGTNLDRNWAFHWSENASSEPCHRTHYRGDVPHSEPEVQALSGYIGAQNVVALLDYHAHEPAASGPYARELLVLRPLSHEVGPTADEELFDRLGRALATCTVGAGAAQGASALVLGVPAGGTMMDWCYAMQGILPFMIDVDSSTASSITERGEQQLEALLRFVDALEAESEACHADLSCNQDVGFSDLVTILSTWGPCPGCLEDLDGSGDVGFADLSTLLAQWGPCP